MKYNGCGSFPGIELLENGLKESRDLIFLSQKKSIYFRLRGEEFKHARVKLEISQKTPCWGAQVVQLVE